MSLVAKAQLSVTSISPAQQAVNVNTETRISIEFNTFLSSELMISNLEEGLLVFPIDSVQLTNFSITESETASTIHLDVLLTDNTDFTVTVLDLRSRDGAYQDKIYTSRFTTGEAFSGFSISGTVVQKNLFPAKKATSEKEVKTASASSIKWFKTTKSGGFTPIQLNEDELDLTYNLLLLTTIPPDVFDDEEQTDEEIPPRKSAQEENDDEGDGPPAGIFTLGHIEDDLSFNLTHIPNGIYYLSAYLFKHEYDEYDEQYYLEPYAVGIYEPENDFVSGPIFVDDSNVTDIVVSMISLDFDPNPVTFNTVYTAIRPYLDETFQNYSVMASFGEEYLYNSGEEDLSAATFPTHAEVSNPTGLSHSWMFAFYVPDSNKAYLGTLSPLGLIYFDADVSPDIDFNSIEPLSETIAMDSDEAMSIALNNGGAGTFLESMPVLAQPDANFVLGTDKIVFVDGQTTMDKLDFEMNGAAWGISFDYWYYENDEYVEKYWFVVIDVDTKAILYSGDIRSVSNETHPSLNSFRLSQNYPNPFNPTTNIAFSLPNSSHVKLSVFNVLGQEVAILANSPFSQGEHTLSFDASALSSGLYFYRIEAGTFRATKSMTLIK
jgi:hypothetical protein